MSSRSASTGASTRSTPSARCSASRAVLRRRPMPTSIPARGRTLHLAGVCVNRIGTFETTEINPTSIINSLEIGRKKLPADRPGIIFVKVPQRCIVEAENAAAMVDAGRKFLRNTDRIVAITFYVSHLETRDNMVMYRHALRELTNETSR